MTIETMSIQRGLAELKLIEKRIYAKVNGLNVVGVRIGEKPVTGFKDDTEFKELANAGFDSVQDLIKRRNAIKGAIVVANATTNVKVGNEEMTIAQAIERKGSIDYEIDLLNAIERQYAATLSDFQYKEQAFKERLDKQLEALYGKEGKTKGSENKEALKPFLDLYEPHLVDPLNIKKVIDELSESIDVFSANVDFALSEINVKTEIEIKY